MDLPDWWPHDKPYAIMDCIKGMQELPDKCVDLILTDPPYGLEFDYGQTYIDTRPNLIKLLKRVLPEILRIGKRIAIMPGITQVFLYPEPNWILSVNWNTTGTFGGCGFSQWFPILFYGEDIRGFGNVNGIIKSDTYSINGGGNVGFQRTDEEGKHCCPKPYEIIEWLCKRLANNGDIILDPFLGSGTTLLACRKTNRIGLGFEVNPDYEPIIRKRSLQDIKPLEEYF